MRRMLRVGLWVVLMAGTITAQTAMAPNPAFDAYLSQQDSVRLVDGRTVHLVCMGTGSPTVLLTAGKGNWSVVWSLVQPEVAKATRVCAWDRPGFGFSSPSPWPQTVDNTTNDLEAALSRGGINGPLILVGHSLGASESLLFTDRHRSSVVGMVLVDPGLPDHLARMGRAAPEVGKEMRAITPQQVAMFTQCAQIVRQGAFAASADESVRCRAMIVSPGFSKALAEALLAWSQDPAQFETQASLFQVAEDSNKRIVNPARHYGSMPVTVLSSTIPDAPPPGTPERQAILAAEVHKALAELTKGHRELAALSTAGVQRSVPDVGHFIQVVKPQAVIEAIGEVVHAVRSR